MTGNEMIPRKKPSKIEPTRMIAIEAKTKSAWRGRTTPRRRIQSMRAARTKIDETKIASGIAPEMPMSASVVR